MGIRVIPKQEGEERLEYKCTDPEGSCASIFYQRIPGHLIMSWRERFRNRRTGLVDESKLAKKAVEYALIDWTGFEDVEGKEFPCSSENFWQLPDEIQGDFVDVLLRGFVPAEDKHEKN